jgi:hypothetical protein
MRRRVILAVTTVLAAGAIGVGAVAYATGNEENLSGPRADRATRAALQATGGGTATAVESDSENGGTYEVEVTKADGSTVDVSVDDNYHVLNIEGDNESGDSGDATG